LKIITRIPSTNLIIPNRKPIFL